MPIRFAQVRMPWSPRGKNADRDAERDADAEIARNLWKHHKILPPTSFTRNIWDWTLLLLVVFSAVQIPFVLAFSLPESTDSSLRILELIIDALFAIDIILIFNTSYYIEDELIHDRKEIAKRYGTSWFAVDLIATLPWETISDDLRSMRLLRLLRLSRVMKKVDSLKGGMGLRFFYLIFWWLLTAHWTACIWWFIGRSGWEDERQYYEDNGKDRDGNWTNWLVRIPPDGTVDSMFSFDVYEACWRNCVSNLSLTPVECKSRRECDDNNFDPRVTSDVGNHWLSSLYWAFTMLMKTPYVGPDTLPEKAFSCIMVIIGAIIFALLLGQVTTLIISASKAGAALRDTLVQYRLFAATRLPRMRKGYELHNAMAKQLQAEWQLTGGMETHSVLEPFPLQLRGDVLQAVYANLLQCDPPYLRCSDQLKRQILGLLRPAVALKKSTVITGRQFNGSLYILLKGTLQVSSAPGEEGKTTDRSAKPDTSPAMGRSKSASGDEMKRKLTRSNTKGFKDKLKVRMLEKPGAIIPLENIDEGAKASPFSVFAVTRCNLLTIESGPLRGVLGAFPPADVEVVKKELIKEFNGLTDSLKMNRNADGSLRMSKVDSEDGSGSKAAAKRPSVTERASVTESVARMEAETAMLIKQVEELTKKATVLPAILKVLQTRMGDAMADSSKSDADKKSGGFFGFGGSPKS